MFRLTPILATAALMFSADSSGVLRPLAHNPIFNVSSISSSGNLPDPQGTRQRGDPPDSAKVDSKDGAEPPAKAKAGPLQPESRLLLVRYVDGELVRVVTPIPAGKKGFHMKAGAPVNENALRMAVASAGSAINPGDHAQITNLDFKDKEIMVEVNGGGRGKTRLRDRIHLEIGGVPTMTTSSAAAPVNTNAGATLFLDFDKPLPDMTPDDLKELLSGILDFSKQHSAAVQWVESLPPEIQKAIQEKQPVVGMDHEMVLAAMGRPDRKVREKTTDGSEIEDWIYGKPPSKTIFVSFEGDKVTKVHQYPE
jgi:hypothetical protein